MESRPNKAGEFPIRISISIRQVRVQSTSGFSVPRDKWVDAIEDENKKKREQKAHHYVILTCVTSKSFKGSEITDPITIVCYREGTRVEETSPKYELIGTHVGRRTFICFALSSDIHPQVVMKWASQSDYKAMKPYIDIAGKAKA